MKKIMILISFLMILSGCESANNVNIVEESYSIFAMDTFMDFTINSNIETEKMVSDKISLLESLFSVTDENSEIYELNTQNIVKLSKDTENLLLKSIELCEKTDGTLDVTIYPALTAWGFTTDSFNIPTENELAKILPLIDYSLVQIEDNVATTQVGVKVDFGAVAKGYAGDIITDMLKEQGVQSALLRLGGNIQAIGTKMDGSLWNIAIQSPFSDGYLGAIPVSDKVVVTSGGYERYFEGQDGQIYSHIIDPKTAKPVDNDIVSVSIITESGLYADALSTSLSVMGLESALNFWQEHKDFDAIIVTEDKNVYITSGIFDEFTPLTTDEVNFIEIK